MPAQEMHVLEDQGTHVLVGVWFLLPGPGEGSDTPSWKPSSARISRACCHPSHTQSAAIPSLLSARAPAISNNIRSWTTICSAATNSFFGSDGGEMKLKTTVVLFSLMITGGGSVFRLRRGGGSGISTW